MVTETGTVQFATTRETALSLQYQWDADLTDMTKIRKENDRVQYVLLVVDIFSKYLWMQPLKDKKGPTTARAFENILSEGRQLTKLCTDKGQEFRSKAFNNV